jgi:hypothetical protein
VSTVVSTKKLGTLYHTVCKACCSDCQSHGLLSPYYKTVGVCLPQIRHQSRVLHSMLLVCFWYPSYGSTSECCLPFYYFFWCCSYDAVHCLSFMLHFSSPIFSARINAFILKHNSTKFCQFILFLPISHSLLLPFSKKTCNYGLCVDKSSLCLTNFLVNIIHIYDFKLIY